MLPTSYNYPKSGEFSETVANFSDGRSLTVNTQHSIVFGAHAEGCEKGKCAKSVSGLLKENARRRAAACTCGTLDGIDTKALVEDARTNGKLGKAPKTVETYSTEPTSSCTDGLSLAEIEQQVKQYDAINNEGGEGFNPYRD